MTTENDFKFTVYEPEYELADDYRFIVMKVIEKNYQKNTEIAIFKEENDATLFAYLKMREKYNGGYAPISCPNCSRNRIEICIDLKHRCEKCFWCIEDNCFDGKYSDEQNCL